MKAPIKSSLVVILAAACISTGSAASDDGVAGTYSVDRAMGAILGSFVADAATMPLHWIYDTKEVAQLVAKAPGQHPEFYDPPQVTFYHYPLGEDSPYGQQSRVYLAALANNDGKVDPSALEQAYYNYYKPGGPCYTTILNGTKCYHDKSTKAFIANEEAGKHYPNCGAVDTQANAIAHMPAVVARHAGEPDLLDQVATMIRVTQNTDDAVAFGLAAARILEKVILGSDGKDAVVAVAKELVDPNRKHPNKEDEALAKGITHVLSELDKSSFDVVQEVGQACDYPYNLWSGAHLIAQNPGFVNGTRQRIMAGGDCASANMFNGAVFGALEGEAGIPADWKAKATHYVEVQANAKKLLAARGARE